MHLPMIHLSRLKWRAGLKDMSRINLLFIGCVVEFQRYVPDLHLQSVIELHTEQVSLRV